MGSNNTFRKSRFHDELTSFLNKCTTHDHGKSQLDKHFLYYDEARNLANMYELVGYTFPGPRYPPCFNNIDYQPKINHKKIRKLICIRNMCFLRNAISHTGP